MLGSAKHSDDCYWPQRKNEHLVNASNSSLDSNESFHIDPNAPVSKNSFYNSYANLPRNSPTPSIIYFDSAENPLKSPESDQSLYSKIDPDLTTDFESHQLPINEFSRLSISDKDGYDNSNANSVSRSTQNIHTDSNSPKFQYKARDSSKKFNHKSLIKNQSIFSQSLSSNRPLSSIPTPTQYNSHNFHDSDTYSENFNSSRLNNHNNNPLFKNSELRVNDYPQKSPSFTLAKNRNITPTNLIIPKHKDLFSPSSLLRNNSLKYDNISQTKLDRNSSAKSERPEYKISNNPSIYKSLNENNPKRSSMVSSKPLYSPGYGQISSFQNRKSSLDNSAGYKHTRLKSDTSIFRSELKSNPNRSSSTAITPTSSNQASNPIRSNRSNRNSGSLLGANYNKPANNNNSAINSKTPLKKTPSRKSKTPSKIQTNSLALKPDSNSEDSVEIPKLDHIKSESSKIQELLKENFDLKIRNRTLMDSLNQLSYEGLEAIINDFTRARASNVRANNEISRLKDKISELKKSIKSMEKDLESSYKCDMQHGMSQEEHEFLESLKSQVIDLESQLEVSMNENKIITNDVKNLKSELERQCKINEQLRIDSFQERAKTELWQNLAQSPQRTNYSRNAGKKLPNLSIADSKNQNRLRTGTSTTIATSETLFNNFDSNSDFESTLPYFGYGSNLPELKSRPSYEELSKKKNLKNHLNSFDNYNNLKTKDINPKLLPLLDNPEELIGELEKLFEYKSDLEQKLLAGQQENEKLKAYINGPSFKNLSLSTNAFENAEMMFLKSKISNLESENSEKNNTIAKLSEFIKNLQDLVDKSSKSYLASLHESTVDPLLEHKVKSLLDVFKRI
ncbi:hypothetical protein AYI70_g10062 [Smittium culicis]|uniref:Centrosomin N-terminal motif 1 domain-containing protein n=1 Tax=Smittium culicis TaxID=133412 RepID=A0A1R1X8B5_9FUNG|nr:hypothetical protein AYI70_g10062 [Smittium culicis]